MASPHHSGGARRGGGRGQGGGQYYDDNRSGRAGGRGRPFHGRQGARGGGGGRGSGCNEEGRGGGSPGRGGPGGNFSRGGGQQGGERRSPIEPPVQRPAGPTLEEQARAGREKVEMMKIHRDAPIFPARPGFGAVGNDRTVEANHFLVSVLDKDLHHYDVTITPESTPRGVYRQIMSTLVSEHRHTELGGRLPAYDGGKSLFTAGVLPFTSKVFDVTLTAERKYQVQVAINYATVVSQAPPQLLQVFGIVLRDVVLSELTDKRYVAFGRSFFSVDQHRDIGGGLEGWRGFYQSIRPTQRGLSLVIDISSTPMVKPLLLNEFVGEALKKPEKDWNWNPFTALNPEDIDKIGKVLKGLKIEVIHRGNQRRKYRILELTDQLLPDVTFESAPGVSKTVKDYFREVYHRDLLWDLLPCIQVGRQRPNYLPMEVCKIVSDQRYQKKLDKTQGKALMDLTCQAPDLREKSISQLVETNKYGSTNRAKEFGVEVDRDPASVQARELPAPKLRYRRERTEFSFVPGLKGWNMINKEVLIGATVHNWACINFCHDLRTETVRRFCNDLVGKCQDSGVDMRSLRLPTGMLHHRDLEDLTKFVQEAREELKCQKIDLLLAILPDKNINRYGNFKKSCDTDIGIMSQCCLRETISKTKNESTLAQIALKINAKVGGWNTALAEESLPVVSNKTTIIFGADVTHPAALDDNSPSIASVVATLDWPEVMKYNGVFRAQRHRAEIISDMEDMVKELLLAFQQKHGKKPEQLIFYRDGVSEGQFKQVLEQEVSAVEKAWKALCNEKPQITFIIVQKRHHTRLFPQKNKSTGKTPKKNVEPGTVVDRVICHPTEFDFFLCSHDAIKGTSRPAHYHVLRDDNKFTADDLQALTYNLCYTYSNCTRQVSFASPAYYAHKLASRARLYLPQDPVAEGQVQLPDVKDELKRTMFYC